MESPPTFGPTFCEAFSFSRKKNEDGEKTAIEGNGSWRMKLPEGLEMIEATGIMTQQIAA